ncbi:MAG: DUF3784 domain-containing protein [Clostridia bacterium]|nr:DUF3784 domain-containing protein [Clostridia bacterium]MBO4428507.1 DUF3784 domain-containing protein [Clostridia bacterium]
MLVGVIVEAAVGAVIVTLGVLIWAKQKISLIHEYHYKNVKAEDVPAYTRLVGIGLIIIGAGIVATGVLNFFHSTLWWVPLAAGFVAGLIVMNAAQQKYNGSWFS